MKAQFFLWPKTNIAHALAAALRMPGTEKIEGKLKEMFPSGYPVLCSSGRAALYIALHQSKVSRRNDVGVFPYASHCVLEAVSRIGTPLTGPTSVTAGLRIVYHQWGFVQEKNLPANAIEDCVDTLCMPGTALFPGGGNFEIWSLPKILGTTSGAVLWCRDEQTAGAVKELRDADRNGFIQWITRLFGYKYPNIYDYWQGAESRYRKISLFQTGEIGKAIDEWDHIVQDRLTKLNLVWPYAVNWLQKPTDRLPTVVPLAIELPEETVISLGITSGYRMIEKLSANGDRQLIKTIPLPIHKEVPVEWVKAILQTITK